EALPRLEHPGLLRRQFLYELAAPVVEAEIVDDRRPAHEVPGRAGTIPATGEETGQPIPETVPGVLDAFLHRLKASLEGRDHLVPADFPLEEFEDIVPSCPETLQRLRPLLERVISHEVNRCREEFH